MRRTRVLMRPPGHALGAGVVSRLKREPVDADRAYGQWQAMRVVLEVCGWTVVVVPPAEDCPDAVFVEDMAVVVDDVAVLARPAVSARRSEVPGVAAVLRALGYQPHVLPRTATFEAGDVVMVGRDVFVGVGGRTNRQGARAFAELLGGRYRVHGVPLHKVMHLNEAVTALPDGTVLGYPPHVDDPSWFREFLPVPEPAGARVLTLDESRVVVSSSAPRTAERLASLGYEVVSVDIGEFEKREGSVTCLALALR